VFCIGRADLIREKYIYQVKVKKVSLKRALLGNSLSGRALRQRLGLEMKKTWPNVSDLLNKRAKTLKLDVLNVIMDNN